MKIGTLTFWYSKENYGAILQCWALLKFLNKMGYDARLVRVQRPWGDISHKWFYAFTNILFSIIYHKGFREIKTKVRAVKSYKTVDRGFSSFIERHVPLYPGVWSFENLNNRPLDVDAVIVGSDQVWSGFSQTFFLHFKGDFKRLSYAPSFGGYKMENPFVRMKVSSWLKRFDLITVRESEGVELCRKLGFSATMVPDPTLLLDKGDYVELENSIKGNRDSEYIFLYLLGSTVSLEVSEIMAFARYNGLDVIYVASQGREDDFEKTYPTVEEWIALVRDAKYVMTNSFHGTVFSLLYEKPFLTLPLSGAYSRMNGRIDDMLNKYELANRVYSGDLNALFKQIDFSRYKEIKSEEVSMVKQMLSNVLDN